MQFAINTPNYGCFGDVRLMAELAHEAEDAGWDAFFIWDHIGGSPAHDVSTADPWIELAAMAMTTSRIKLGTIVTPLPRRRPWKLAKECATIDNLSNGRLILGVGIGGDGFRREYSTYNEPTDTKVHGAMLDEGLDVLTLLWSGETVNYSGHYYQLNNALMLPTPVQKPRIPIWVAGVWPAKKPFRRAAAWDGICPLNESFRLMEPEDIRMIVNYIQQFRASEEPFAVLATGRTTGTDRQQDYDKVMPYIEAGANWWQEGFAEEEARSDIDVVRQRIRKGPPRI